MRRKSKQRVPLGELTRHEYREMKADLDSFCGREGEWDWKGDARKKCGHVIWKRERGKM
jgi:hypothetical protein